MAFNFLEGGGVSILGVADIFIVVATGNYFFLLVECFVYFLGYFHSLN